MNKTVQMERHVEGNDEILFFNLMPYLIFFRHRHQEKLTKEGHWESIPSF